MRIIYTFQKKNRFWIVNCPSDKSITESSYNSLIEAINTFLANHENIRYFDIVIPSTVPTPIQFKKNIRVKRLPDTKKPKTSHKFKYDSKWAIITPPFEKHNVLILHDPFRKHNKFNPRIKK